jgi:hypothetical protein
VWIGSLEISSTVDLSYWKPIVDNLLELQQVLEQVVLGALLRPGNSVICCNVQGSKASATEPDSRSINLERGCKSSEFWRGLADLRPGGLATL